MAITLVARQSLNIPPNCLPRMNLLHRSVSPLGTLCTGSTPLGRSRLLRTRTVASMVPCASVTLCKRRANDHRASGPRPCTCSSSRVSRRSTTRLICWRPAPCSWSRSISLFVIRIKPVSSPSKGRRAARAMVGWVHGPKRGSA